MLLYKFSVQNIMYFAPSKFHNPMQNVKLKGVQEDDQYLTLRYSPMIQ